MNFSGPSLKAGCLLGLVILTACGVKGHNGKIAYAYPLGTIRVDGDLSDWPENAKKFPLSAVIIGERIPAPADFSGYFQTGYRADNRSLYIAFTITDDSFIQDTSENVRYNTQDGLELCLDARHLPFGSGVASFMYSRKLKNVNNALFDPFAKSASWDIMEVSMTTRGNVRYYEWRIQLGSEFAVGKSVGLDVQLFDKDADGSFTGSGWGKGGFKFRIPGSLGDIILMAPGQKLASVSGNVRWDRVRKSPLPGQVTFTSAQKPALWVQAEVDSTGHYTADIPAGQYTLSFPTPYFASGEHLFAATASSAVTATAGKKVTAPDFIITGTPVPHLIPQKGVMHDYGPGTVSAVDHFIETYRQYLDIPGVSLALIKDGKLVYHKTYGVKNTITGEKVDENTLFEAASVTKPVFSFAVLRLVEKGIIDLDKPLYQYLPYPDIAHDERYKLITARHVLTHRTGFPNWRYMNEDGKLNIRFTPGTQYNYSGEGFEYLKLVVEKTTGKKVEQVLKEEVLDPVGLYHTFFSSNDSLVKMVANGHYDRMPSYGGIPESPGMAYSMHTEAKIFSRFAIYMLEQQGLKPQTYDSMFSKHSEFNYDPGDEKPKFPAYMGISLEIRETPFGKTFGHGGNNGDFLCHFEVYKDLKMGYIVFTNSNTSYPMLKALREFLIEGKHENTP